MEEVQQTAGMLEDRVIFVSPELCSLACVAFHF